MALETYDYLVRILLLGNSGVGKAAICNRFVHDTYCSTIFGGYVIGTYMYVHRIIRNYSKCMNCNF